MKNHRRTVESGYDRVAERYLATKDTEDPPTLAALEKMTGDLPTGSPILDLGCGVDLSEKQLELARKLTPDARFLKADMRKLHFEPGTFSAAVALFSITHVPREEQPALVTRLHRWLEPGGRFLATWGVEAWGGGEKDWEGWGVPMWWSNQNGETNLGMLRGAGFVVSSVEEHGDRGTDGSGSSCARGADEDP